MTKPKVAFICVHNSCRSQIAEALGKLLASDVFESYSAGTEIAKKINSDAVRTMKRLYGIDLTQTQRPKTVSEIPLPDIVVSMGCEVCCPLSAERSTKIGKLPTRAGKPTPNSKRSSPESV